MRTLAFFMLAVAAGGCSGSPSDDEVDVDFATSSISTASVAQTTAFDTLVASTQRSWQWVQDAAMRTPKHLAAARVGTPVIGADGDAARATLSILKEHKDLFRLRDPELELSVSRVLLDDLGMRHARFQQMTHGVPVAGAQLAAHYDEEGRVASIDSNYVPDLDGIDVNPTVTENDAHATAVGDVVRRIAATEAEIETRSQRLIVYAPRERAQSARLAYEFKLGAMAAATPGIWMVTVDAKTNEVLDAYDNLQTVEGRGTGVLGDTKTFEISTADGTTYVLSDTVNKVPVQTLSAEGKNTRGKPVSSKNRYTWDAGVIGAGSAVDAHFHAMTVSRYYLETHARKGINGIGGALVSTVHYGTSYDNAAWDGSGMIYGDGGDVFYPPAVSLDVVGHEFTHGVTQATSALLYKNQPGALNEAVSDIFGAFIEHFLYPDEEKNWTIGEKALKAGGALRDMRTPGSVKLAQPAHMSEYNGTLQDNGGVHANSGIINNAAYLMTAGGENPVSGLKVEKGIGWAKSEQLWYRANTHYFMEETDFGQAAHALLQAARDLKFTAEETQAVGAALVATGIVDETALNTAAADGTTSSRRRKLVVTQGSTCSASGRNSSKAGIEALLAAVAGLAWLKRRRR